VVFCRWYRLNVTVEVRLIWFFVGWLGVMVGCFFTLLYDDFDFKNKVLKGSCAT